MTAGALAGKTRDLVNVAGKYAAAMGTLAAVATGKMVATQLDAIDTLGKTADSIGIATDKLAGYQHAATIAGVSNEGLQKAFQKMGKNLGEASIGIGQSVYWLEELGLNTEAFFAQTPDQQFNQVADSIAVMESAQQRAAAAQAVFGREGIKMTNMLRGGSQGLKDLAREAEIAGTALSRIDVAKVEQANDSMARAKLAATGFAQQVTIGVAPVIEDLATRFFNVGQEAGGMAGAAGNAINFVLDGVGVFADGVFGLQLAFKGLTTIVARSWKFVLDGLVDIDQSLTAFLNKLPAWMGGGSYEESQAMKEAAAVMTGVFEDMAGGLDEMVTKGLPSDRLKDYVNEVQRASQETAEATASSIAVVNTEVQSSFDTLREKTKDSATFVKDTWNGVVGQMQGQFSTFFTDIFGNMGGFSSSVSGLIMGGGASLFSGAANASGGGFSLSNVLSGAGLASNLAGGNLALMEGASVITSGLYNVAPALGQGFASGVTSLAQMAPGGLMGAGAIGIGAAMAISSIIDSMTGQNRNHTLGITAGSRPGDNMTRAATAASGLELFGIAQRTNSGQADQLLDLILGLDSQFVGAAAGAGYSIDLSGGRLAGGTAQPGRYPTADQSFFGLANNGDASKGEIEQAIREAPAKYIQALIDATADQFDAATSEALQRLDGSADEMVAGFMEIFGFDAVRQSFGDLFMSGEEAEQAALVRNVETLTSEFERLTGQAIPRTREQMQAFASGIDTSAAANADLVAGLAELAPALGEYYDLVEDIAKAMRKTNDVVEESVVLEETRAEILAVENTWLEQRAGEIISSYQEEIRLAGELHATQIAGLEEQARIGSALLGAAKRLQLSGLSPLSNADRLTFASGEFARLETLARGGDLQAAGMLGAAADAYLAEAAAYYASSQPYVDIFNDVSGTLRELGVTLGGQGVEGEMQRLNDAFDVAREEARRAAVQQIEQLSLLVDGNGTIADLLARLPGEIASILSDLIGGGGSASSSLLAFAPGGGGGKLAGKTAAQLASSPTFLAALGELFEPVGPFPAFADGGVVNRPTVGLIGEAGSEAVIPLKGGAVPVKIDGGVMADVRDQLVELRRDVAELADRAAQQRERQVDATERTGRQLRGSPALAK